MKLLARGKVTPERNGGSRRLEKECRVFLPADGRVQQCLRRHPLCDEKIPR